MTPPRAPSAALPLTPGLRAVLACAAYVLLGGLAVSAFGGAGGDGPRSVEQKALAYAIGLGAVLVVFAWWRPPSRCGRLAPGAVLLSYLVLLLAWVPVGMVLYPYLLERAGIALPPQSQLVYLVGDDRSWRAVFVVLVACVLAPVVEEVVFRGFVQPALRGVMPVVPAVVCTAALFGLMHGAVYALPVGLLGLWFGYLRERHGGLAAPVLGHMLHNSTTVLVTVFAPQTLDWVYR